MSLKAHFTQEYSSKVSPKLIVVIVQLPSGALEVIANYEDLEGKYFYYLETYDKDMVMVKNPNIRIVGWIIV